MSRLVDMIYKLRAAGKSVDQIDPDDYADEDGGFRPPLLGQSAGRRVAPSQPGAGSAIFNAGTPRSVSGNGTFRDFGEFANAVRIASNPEPGAAARRVADQLRNAALTTYGSEGVGSDGGFAVPPEFVADIMHKVQGEESLLGRCDVIPTTSPLVPIPKDETSNWSTTGIRAYWEGEAKAMPQSRPVLESSTIKLHKLQALVPMTDELLEDAPALAKWLTVKAAEVIDFKVTDAIVNGTGVGQPLGILNAAHTVDVAKETSQVAATIHGLNLVKMWSRMPAAWRRSAVWLVHPDAEPQLLSAALQVKSADGTSTTGGSLVYVPPGSLADSPYGSLFGRPVIPSQACQALGTRGDLIFASLSNYAAFLRSPGLRTDVSIHMWFDQGVTAFRFSLRLGGQPWWSTPITDKNGSNTRSAFVALATRG